MNLRRSIRLSVRALFASKGRAILALTSVSIGVAAVVLISAIGAGARREVNQRIEAMGTNLIVVRPAQTQRLVSRKTIRGFVRTLKPEDFQAIAELPVVAAAAPGAETPVRAKAGNIATITKVLGTSRAYPIVRNFQLREGRFFDADDEAQARRVAVLASRVADALFANETAVGREIRIRGVPFDVIGVLESKGVLPDGSDEDNQILIPLKTALRRVTNTTALSGVFVSVTDPARMDEARAAITTLVRARHGRDDFSIQNTTKFASMQRQSAELLTLFGLGLGGVALLVGGTGILALMMMSVKQRTSEIGLRMALGATPRNVLMQFLLEATLLALAGWAAGLAMSGVGALVMKLATDWKLALPINALLASATMVLITGVGFGAVPARKASRMQPIEALRSR